MAKPTTTSGAKMLIKIDDGTGNFVAPAGLNTKGLSRSAAANSIETPDASNPDLPIWVDRIVSSLSAQITGAGHMAAESIDLWDAFYEGGVSRQVQFVFTAPPALAGRTYQGAYVCTKLDITGATKDRVAISTQLDSDGQIQRV